MTGAMRAAVLHTPGPPSNLRVEQVDIPGVGAGQVLIRVGAAGVSSHDVVERKGIYRRGVKLPLIQGIEAAGTIVELGPEVDGFAVGDRVAITPFHGCGACRLCRNGHETSCASRVIHKGAYAEFMAVHADGLVRIPDTVTFSAACMLGAATGVALNAVRDAAQVRVAEAVLVTGASGGIGLPAIELIKASGARVIAQTRTPGKVEALHEAGADDVVVSSECEAFSDDIRQMTGGGVDAVIDTVGSPVFTQAFRSLASHGRYAVVGQLTGDEVSINLARIFFKRITLVGVGSVSRAQLEDVVTLVDRGLVRPRVAAELPLEEAAQAHELVEQGELFGRVVLVPTAVRDS